MTRLRQLVAQLPYVPRTLALVWGAARGWTLAWMILLLVQALLPLAIVLLTRNVVDAIVSALSGGAVAPALYFAGGMALLLLVMETARSVTGWVRTAQSELVRDHVTSLIHAKSVEADLAFYEWPEFYDHLHRARAEAATRPIALLENIGTLLQNAVTLVAMAAVIAPFGVWMPLALVVSTLPALYVVLRSSAEQHAFRHRTTPDERRTWYFDWLLTDREAASEMRLFDLGAYFRTAHRNLRRRLSTQTVALAWRHSLAEMLAGTSALVVSAGALLWMVWRAASGLVTLGDLALFAQAFQQGSRLARGLLENAGQVYANSLFLSNLFEFLALEPRVTSPAAAQLTPQPLQNGITFRNVSFCYPGSERMALRGMTLVIPAGRITAIVGGNGAGKSTLLKLLCRFYDPTEGAIELDGVDLRRIELDDLRGRISALFQTPVRYSATVADNVTYGTPAAEDSAVDAALGDAGARAMVAGLPAGRNTMLGTSFDAGTDLSVGEWQRLGLARALLRRAPIVILDEPTSAMDPWAESEWLPRLRQAVAGATVLIITHRLTTAREADWIGVMVDGRVVEMGSHDELLAANGAYAAAWRGQFEPAGGYARF